MNQEYFDIVFQGLKDHIKTHSEIKAKVLDRPNTEIYPKIVVTEITNTSTLNLGRMESYSLLGYEIGIYAKTQLSMVRLWMPWILLAIYKA